MGKSPAEFFGASGINGYMETETLELNQEEKVIKDFMQLCQSSLDPENYENVEKACKYLCKTRYSLNDSSLNRCLMHLIQCQNNSSSRSD